MEEIFREVISAKFLVITVCIGIALSIVANILTPYIQGLFGTQQIAKSIVKAAVITWGVVIFAFVIAFAVDKFSVSLVPWHSAHFRELARMALSASLFAYPFFLRAASFFLKDPLDNHAFAVCFMGCWSYGLLLLFAL